MNKQVAREIAEILLDIKAVSLNLETPFRYASGIVSPIYTDNRLLMSYPEKRKKVIAAMEKILSEKTGVSNIDIIAGTATAGIPHAAWLASKMEKPMIYARSSHKAHGKQNKIEGKLEEGQKVVIVEDLISTGGSSIDTVNAVKDAGGKVICCIAIFSYGMPHAHDAFLKAKVDLVTLTDFPALLEVAVERKYVSGEESKKILEWAKDPENWGRKMGFE